MKKRGIFLALLIAASLIFLLAASAADEQVYRSTKIWTSEPGGEHLFFISSKDITITRISFSTITDLKDAKMIIEAQQTPPPTLKSADNAYQYITIGKFGIPDEDVRGISIQFRVPKSGPDSSPNSTKASLYYFDGYWKETQAEYTSYDQTYYYYKSSPPIFTYYAISLDSQIKKTETETALTFNPAATVQKNTSTQNSSSAIDEKKQGLFSIIKGFDLSKNNSYLFIGVASACIILLVTILTFLSVIFKGEYFENEDALLKVIDEELSEGVPRKEIESEAIKGGWPKRVVDKIVHNEKLPHDTEVKIKAYIHSMKEKAASSDAIKKSLIKEGWAEDTIDYLLKETNSF